MRGLGTPPTPQAPGEAHQASKEEQAVYNRVIGTAMVALYEEKFLPKVVQVLETAVSPEQGVGDVVSMLGLRVFKSAQKNKIDVPPDVVFFAGADLVELVAEVHEASGLGKLSEDQKMQAFYIAADKFQETDGGDKLPRLPEQTTEGAV